MTNVDALPCFSESSVPEILIAVVPLGRKPLVSVD